MNEREQQEFEAELRRLKPAAPPAEWMRRVRAAKPPVEPVVVRSAAPPVYRPNWRLVFRWLAPAAALAALAFFLMPAKTAWPEAKKTAQAGLPRTSPAAAGLRADDVQVDHDLVASFDVVATLPGGEPVRFHCRQLNDEWRVTDKRRGVQIEESRPRMEVTPVRFETY